MGDNEMLTVICPACLLYVTAITVSQKVAADFDEIFWVDSILDKAIKILISLYHMDSHHGGQFWTLHTLIQ